MIENNYYAIRRRNDIPTQNFPDMQMFQFSSLTKARAGLANLCAWYPGDASEFCIVYVETYTKTIKVYE